MHWLIGADGSCLNLEHYVALHVVNADQDPNKPTVIGNGFQPAVIVGVTPANARTIVASGYRHELEPALAWISERLGRAAVIRLAEFLDAAERKGRRIELPGKDPS
jgi:hypothetical protein